MPVWPHSFLDVLSTYLGNIGFLAYCQPFIIMKTRGEVNHSLHLPKMPSVPTVAVCQDLSHLKGKT
jgi:hypothetical protein